MVRNIRLAVDNELFERAKKVMAHRKWTWEDFLKESVRKEEEEIAEDTDTRRPPVGP